ncbi:DNA polymerase III subunit delta' [Rhodoferax sp.]|uniref:DNA polymerase III subunit delta' n=1 Tax=Rhodoferax sp. TaxID=50421 RepID=UPI003784F327
MSSAVQNSTNPAWIAQQTEQLLRQSGHAWLLQGPSGLGQYRLALALAQAFLCESVTPQGACGQCASCHAVDVRTHADLCVLMPETALLALAWPLPEKAQTEIDEKKRKPSQEIRVEAMRDAIGFSQRTSARGRGKVVLIFPAEKMNPVTSNALLKTLEEPPGDVRFLLATESAHQLLPTIRSRCLSHTMAWPSQAQALQWLEQCGVQSGDAITLLRAAGGRPEDAMDLLTLDGAAQKWAGFPAAIARGDTEFVRDWPVRRLIDGLQKLCHDLCACQVGAPSRFFESDCLRALGRPRLAALTGWSAQLARARRTMEHPWNGGLMQEALVACAQSTLNSAHK